jgi:hypothetical protein
MFDTADWHNRDDKEQGYELHALFPDERCDRAAFAAAHLFAGC